MEKQQKMSNDDMLVLIQVLGLVSLLGPLIVWLIR